VNNAGRKRVSRVRSRRGPLRRPKNAAIVTDERRAQPQGFCIIAAVSAVTLVGAAALIV
jgi:hypothetical protein